jgi:hypothetical protein
VKVPTARIVITDLQSVVGLARVEHDHLAVAGAFNVGFERLRVGLDDRRGAVMARDVLIGEDQTGDHCVTAIHREEPPIGMIARLMCPLCLGMARSLKRPVSPRL